MSQSLTKQMRTPCDPAAPADGDTAYLRMLGRRVRETRAMRGMTRKILSEASGLSQRYLAQVEAGEGNLSIIRLRQLAGAMGVPLADLLTEGSERSADLALIIELLQRLAPSDQAEARRLLLGRFGGEQPDRRQRIALIGLRGAGKSTLGTMLAKALGLPFVEVNREVEALSGFSLSEIFNLYGQAVFRRYERRALEAIIQRHDRVVIATGGSLVTEPGTFDLLLSECFTVWVKTSPEEHMARVVAQGDHRPMADNREAMDDLRQILSTRTALYAMADAEIDTTGHEIAKSLRDLQAAVAPAAVSRARAQ